MAVAFAQRSPSATQPAVSPMAASPASAGSGASAPSFLSATTPAVRLGSGESLSAPVQNRLESSFGTSFDSVRVHRDSGANSVADGLGARGFTVGSNIVLGSGQSASDLWLMGHEAAHVVQQRGGGGAVQTFSNESVDPLEVEAASASRAVVRGEAMSIEGRTAPRVQREGLLDWAEGTLWGLLERYVPELVPILRKGPEGVFDWLKDKISFALEAMFTALMAPVRTVAGIGQWLSGYFAPLLAWMQDAAAKIARNDCSPLREGAEQIEKVVTAFITPIVEKIQLIAGKVGDFFKWVWNKLGAPVWEWIKQYAGQQWELIKSLATWIWDKTAPVRKLLSRAWTWLKNKIGIGEGPEGQDGILQWVQRKAEAVWDWIKAKIEPYKKQLMAAAAVIGGILLLVSPAGPVIIIGGIIYGVVQGVRWIKANWKGDLIVKARTYVEKTLIPSVLASVNKVTAAISKMAASINGKLGELSASMGRMVGTVAESILRFAVAAVQWIADQISALAKWGSDKLAALAEWIGTGLVRLQKFLQPIMEFLGKVASLLIDIWGLPLLLYGKLWNLIPQCIRDPVVDFIIPLILRQIEIFSELVKDNEAWQKTKANVMNIIRMVFVNKDLKGAIKATFHLILQVFNLTEELLVQVAKKAQAAWDVVTAAPLKFLKNCVRTVGRGLKMYWDKLWENLLGGVEGWLFGEVAQQGITKPNSWTDPWDLMQFALSVMGLSMDHIFDLMEKRYNNKEGVASLRKWWKRITRVWDWIMEQKGKSPGEVTAAIITNAKDFGKTVLEGIVSWIVERVGAEIAVMATAAAASAGLSEALDIVRRIYRVLISIKRWARQVVDMINNGLDSVLDIASGNIESAAGLVHGALKRGTPVIIGFLADQVGLSGVGQKIREIIDKLRAKVDDAINLILDKLKAAFLAIAGAVKKAVGAVLEWWKRKITVGEGADKHTLSFQGDEENAELYLESSPTKLETMINKLKDDPAYQSPAKLTKLDAAAALIPVIRADRSKARALRNAGKDADAETLVVKINANFDLIGDYLGVIFKGDPYGTESDPIPIDWPAPASSAYPILYFGSRLRPEQRPKKQSVLKSIFRKGQKDENGKPVLEYYPHVRKQLPDGETIGLSSDYFIPHQAIGPLSTETTPGGGKLDRAIAPYGFSSTDDGMQLDHVHEIQFGGRAKNDRLENLWPLDSSTNASKGSTLSRATVKFPKGKESRITELKLLTGKRQFWFKVKSTQ